jgi:hypothetical protein
VKVKHVTSARVQGEVNEVNGGNMSEERLKLLKELQAEWDEWQMKLALDRLFKNRKLKERRKGTK